MWSRSRVERSCVGHRVRCSTYTQYAIHKLSKSTHVVRFHISSHLVVVSFWLFSESVCATPHFQPRPPTNEREFAPCKCISGLDNYPPPSASTLDQHEIIGFLIHQLQLWTIYTRETFIIFHWLQNWLWHTLHASHQAPSTNISHINFITFSLSTESCPRVVLLLVFSVGRKSLLFMPSKRLTARLRPH